MVTILKSKNIIISDDAETKSFLNHVNYYRFSGYFLPFQVNGHGPLFSNIKFERLKAIYEFDEQLRNLIAGTIDEIEIYLRTQLSYYHAHKYGEEGYMLNNFGIEGVSYEMVDGYPKYTDVITNNPDGLAIGQAMPLYFRASTEGPLVQDVRYIEQYYAEPAQKEALDVWSNCNHDAHIMPQITLTEDEGNEYSKLMTAIGTYVSEMMVKFIVGEEPIENFDKYIETLKGMNIDRAIEIQQAALDRFNAR